MKAQKPKMKGNRGKKFTMDWVVGLLNPFQKSLENGFFFAILGAGPREKPPRKQNDRK